MELLWEQVAQTPPAPTRRGKFRLQQTLRHPPEEGPRTLPPKEVGVNGEQGRGWAGPRKWLTAGVEVDQNEPATQATAWGRTGFILADGGGHFARGVRKT